MTEWQRYSSLAAVRRSLASQIALPAVLSVTLAWFPFQRGVGLHRIESEELMPAWLRRHHVPEPSTALTVTLKALAAPAVQVPVLPAAEPALPFHPARHDLKFRKCPGIYGATWCPAV